MVDIARYIPSSTAWLIGLYIHFVSKYYWILGEAQAVNSAPTNNVRVCLRTVGCTLKTIVACVYCRTVSRFWPKCF